MKKGLLLAAVAAMTVALASPMAVKAESAESESGSIEIVAATDPKGVSVGDSSDDVNDKWGTSLDSGYEVSFVGDAHVKGTVAEDYTQDFTADADIVVHYAKSGPVVLGSSFTLAAKDLSPIIYLKKASSSTSAGKKSTNTSDSGNGLWAGAMLVSLICAAGAFIMSKRNA